VGSIHLSIQMFLPETSVIKYGINTIHLILGHIMYFLKITQKNLYTMDNIYSENNM
jgi:hypothetical protein